MVYGTVRGDDSLVSGDKLAVFLSYESHMTNPIPFQELSDRFQKQERVP